MVSRNVKQDVPSPRKTTQIADDRTFPLCVDLDGTLINTDLLVESIFALLRKNFLYLFLLPVWLLYGKANLKQQIANRVDLDVSLLPYNQPLLTYLKDQHARGRSLILATASNIKYGQQISEYLKLFDQVQASSDSKNLSGTSKLDQLQKSFGKGKFDYAGNSRNDLKIMPYARQCIWVNPSLYIKFASRQLANTERIFDDKSGGFLAYIKAIRLYHWVKNLLIFVPLLAAHRVMDVQSSFNALVGFVAFGLCASSVYLLNDLVDLPLDRSHPTKRSRPFAAGKISIVLGTLLIPFMLTIAFSLSLTLPLMFSVWLAGYFVINLMYSFWAKKIVMVDVIILAGLYTLRLIAGAEATSLELSFWLLAFSMFFFLSLAMAKRYSELHRLLKRNEANAKGRGYQTIDLASLRSLGGASGYLSVLVLALYIHSESVRELYNYPEVIWLLCPLLLYWIGRIWVVTHRGKMDEDPLVFSIRDRVSIWVVSFGISILFFAT